jgi:hypothetical protein
MAANRKKEKQKQKKAAHSERLKAAKAKRRVEPLLSRAEPTKEEKQTILIVCEGKNTEPSYFNQFRLTSAKIKALGKGYNTVSLVEQAIKLQEKENCDQVWCVFDMDSNSPQNFNNAIEMADVRGFGIAYSNQAFEYWFILHFEDHQGGPMERTEYNAKINKYINPFGVDYDGDSNKLVSDKFFNLLMGIDENTGKKRMELAIKRAKRNYKLFDHSSPANEESSTTVFRLVNEILKYV